MNLREGGDIDDTIENRNTIRRSRCGTRSS